MISWSIENFLYRDKPGAATRAVYFCKTCDFRLPFCVRSDRRFCQERCRIWWYWHPGRKRFDFSPGGWGLPAHLGKRQPKTLAEALRALTAARKHAAELEGAARAMQLVDHQLRSTLTELRTAAITSRRELMQEIEALHDELESIQQEREQAAEHLEAKGLREQVALLTAQLQQSEDEAAALRSARDRAVGEQVALRTVHEEQAARHEEEVRLLKSQAATTIALRDHLNRQHADATRSRDEARGQLEKTQHDTAAKQMALAQVSAELAELRRVHEQTVERHAQDISQLRSQAAYEEAQRSKGELLGQLGQTQAAAAETERVLELTSADLAEQRGRADKAERELVQREEALKQQSRLFAAAKEAHRETHIIAESDSRSLRAEKVRRLASEQRVEQLTRELEAAAHQRQLAADYELEELILGRRDDALAAELRDVRVHRDDAIAEREHLSARLLKLMAPDQYVELAARAGYDLTTDPLVQLKREDVQVEDLLGQWQEIRKKPRKARRLKPEQTLVEQAGVAAMAYRLHYFNHPHRSQKERPPRWIIVGWLLDKKTERYLFKRAVRRIARNKKITKQLMEEAAA